MGMAERESKPDFMNTDNAYVNRAEDLATVWAYVRPHGDEISRQIEANEAD